MYSVFQKKLISFCNLITWPTLAFAFLVNGISIPKKQTNKQTNKALNIEFWVVSTHAVKIWDHLYENWSSLLDNEMISKFLKHCIIIARVHGW